MSERMRWWAAAAGIGVALVGATVLGGWFFDIESLKTVYGPITMKANTSVAFLLCGTALWLLSRRWRTTAAICAAAGGAIGAATLMQHVTGWDLGIDQILFTELPGAAATASPNRMGPHASLSLTLAGTAMVLLRWPTPQATRGVQVLAFTGIAFSLVAITGYIYGATELFGIARYTGIALHTAIGFFVLHAGVLAAGSQYGAMAAFADEGVAGTVIRRLSIPVIALPLLFGYLVIVGRERAIFDRGLSYALFAVSVIVILLATVWHTAAVIQVSDRERQRARDEAERANRLKDQFIAVLSHELRTPLNVMLGRLQLLEGEIDRETRVRVARIVARNGRLLARLVEDLLDLSRAAAGQFEIAPAPVQLNAVVRAAVDAHAPDAAAKGVDLVADLDGAVGIVEVDQQRFQQVVSNLVANAVKFTSAGGRIDVRTEHRGGHVLISVADTGLGFDRDFAEQLFQPFRQADASFRREHGGLGLGLSIARHLVELHGGSISATSPGPGKGATFVINLALAASETAPSQARASYARATT
jgi:signal transduction histidine kinase